MKRIDLPFVSICTPTFNRRPFIPFMIKCFENQTYPKDRIEWIIIDDGTDAIKDLVETIPQVKYYYYTEKMLLGKKRNLMHKKCSGDIIIYMDDDDYYPVERISHAVETLQKNPSYLIAGSSEMHIYFDSRNAVFQCGPYKQYHSTAATFAFRKELLLQTKYNDENALAEENTFTKGYSIPLIQLDTLKSILVFSHKHNSLNKEKLLENPQLTRTVPSRFKVDDFIKDPVLKQFYMYDMNNVLENYEPGRPENKPEVMEQIKKMEEITLTKNQQEVFEYIVNHLIQEKVMLMEGSAGTGKTTLTRSICNYFNEKGDTLYSEFWKKACFQQNPIIFLVSTNIYIYMSLLPFAWLIYNGAM
jgi:glycosyltransferase involved in cell wall biosynthesis